ncbi:MAG: metallophosphoesterase family protein [Planctomycetota bacterium]
MHEPLVTCWEQEDRSGIGNDPSAGQGELASIPLVGNAKALATAWSGRSAPSGANVVSAMMRAVTPCLPGTSRHKRLQPDTDGMRLEQIGDEATAGFDVLVLADIHQPADGYRPISGGGHAPARDFVSEAIEQAPHDLLILAGDLTDTGHPSAWRQVHSLLASERGAMLAVPGNHDRQFQGSEQAGMPPATVAERLHDTTGQEPGFPLVQRFDKQGQGLVVIGLDSCRRDARGIIDNALGEVGQEQLRQAGERLQKLRQQDDAVLLAMHHHLKGGPPLLRLLDADRVLDFIEREQVDVVVSGHIHSPQLQGHGNAVLVGVGSAHGPGEGPYASEAPGASGYLLRMGREGLQSARLLQPGFSQSEVRQDGRHAGSSHQGQAA